MKTCQLFLQTGMVRFLQNTEQVLLVATSDRSRVCIFRLGGIYGPGRELALPISPNGRRLASATAANKLQLWDLQRGRLIRTFVEGASKV